MPEPTIRLMRPDEADAVADLVLHANADNIAGFPPEIAAGYRSEIARTAGRFRRGETYVAVAEPAGTVVGTITLVPDAGDDSHQWPPGGAVLRFLAVAPNHRGRRLGERLTATCIERATALGAAFVALHTAPVMVGAQRIYQQAGFVRTPDHDFHPAAHYGGRHADDPPWGLAYMLRLRPAMRIDLPAHPTSASLARAAVRQACNGTEVDLHAVLLCASELVTNAVLHGKPPIELAVDVDGSRVRVEVRDGGTGVVRRRRPVTPDTISGRGLDIVETLASAWGTESNATGKVTWFEIGAD